MESNAESERELSEAAREIARAKTPIDPEILAWALNNIDEAEIAANLKEIRETGGLRLIDFEAELEQIARG